MRFLLSVIFLASICAMKAQTFVDQSISLGIENTYGSCFLGGGISFTDYNSDGMVDLLIPTCEGQPFLIYEGNGSGFEEVFHPVLMSDTLTSKAVYAVDLDNDGDREIFVCNLAAPNKLYWNNGIDGYEDVSENAGVAGGDLNSFAACFADFDHDGWLDFYVGNRAELLQPMANYLYRNNGDGTFSNMAGEAGVSNIIGATLAVGFVDINNDSWPDLYVANDKLTGNKLYKNLGDGNFEDISESAGVDLDMDAMSVCVSDINHDGWMDIYVTNTPSGGNKLLVNNGDETFTESAESLGVAVNQSCWGGVFVDYDSDADQDLFVASMSPPFGSQNRFFVNFEGQFIEWSDEAIPQFSSSSMGAAKADFDHDGDYDLVVMAGGSNNLQFLENTSEGNHFIGISLEGTVSNREGIGARIVVTTADTTQYFETKLGGNFAAQDSQELLVGLGTADSVSVTLHWPSGIVMELPSLDVNTHYHWIETLPIGISELEDEVKIWPNPVRNNLQIAHLPADSWVALYDLQGRVVLKKQRVLNAIHRMNLEPLENGVYLLTIFAENQVFSSTVIKH